MFCETVVDTSRLGWFAWLQSPGWNDWMCFHLSFRRIRSSFRIPSLHARKHQRNLCQLREDIYSVDWPSNVQSTRPEPVEAATKKEPICLISCWQGRHRRFPGYFPSRHYVQIPTLQSFKSNFHQIFKQTPFRPCKSFHKICLLFCRNRSRWRRYQPMPPRNVDEGLPRCRWIYYRNHW